jgi:SAM-dependent methyltransferase
MITDDITALFSDEELAKHIEEANSGGGYEYWKAARYFVTEAIHKDGTFLDVGCANGFLMKCLLSWSNNSITPYGVDNRAEVIEKAKLLFPEITNNFVHLDGDNLKDLETKKMPLSYDFVYRNYWKLDTDEKYTKEQILTLLDHTKEGGRSIIGMYWPNMHPINSMEHQRSDEKCTKFRDFLISCAPRVDGQAFSETGHQWLMWIDKSSS